MGLPKRLTEMQQRFAEYLVFGDENGPLTKTESALRISEETAYEKTILLPEYIQEGIEWLIQQ